MLLASNPLHSVSSPPPRLHSSLLLHASTPPLHNCKSLVGCWLCCVIVAVKTRV
ncbi:hypothetical protein GIB67_036408 [Kingdonia uniflora]|uniref:Uncharacterized protein n=1 Tax=Kingdonia uniflora TaxID=39325 RepID=A0A7J7L408_9MAGN|nr:hypothetical protein GIB67_036408 [Kingdonia uniflora]